MGKMSRISYLCETDNLKELIEEVGTELAEGFLRAHKEMRAQKDNPAFTKLNDIADEMQDEYKKSQKYVYISDVNKEIAKEMRDELG